MTRVAKTCFSLSLSFIKAAFDWKTHPDQTSQASSLCHWRGRVQAQNCMVTWPDLSRPDWRSQVAHWMSSPESFFSLLFTRASSTLGDAIQLLCVRRCVSITPRISPNLNIAMKNWSLERLHVGNLLNIAEGFWCSCDVVCKCINILTCTLIVSCDQFTSSENSTLCLEPCGDWILYFCHQREKLSFFSSHHSVKTLADNSHTLSKILKYCFYFIKNCNGNAHRK